MRTQDRRGFLRGTAATAAVVFGARGAGGASPSPTVDLGSSAGSVEEQTAAWKAFGNEGKKPLRLGLIIGIGNDPDAAMAKVHALGLADLPGLLRGVSAWARGEIDGGAGEVRD